jgi:retinol dehydrogenase 12
VLPAIVLSPSPPHRFRLLLMPHEPGQQRDLSGRTAVVTGASSGIGRAVAIGLARRGCSVVLACRSAERTRPIVEEIAALPGVGAAEHVPLDLADLDSVRACARQLLARDRPLDALVNNAGSAGQRGTTSQGFELGFGINHLGHFLLTTSLLEPLRAGDDARVVTLASQAHFGARTLDFEAVQKPTRTWTGVVEYQVAKLCNVLFTQELARRLKGQGVSAYAVHPGFVATNIWQRRVPWPYRSLYAGLLVPAEDGAATPLACATAEGIQGQSGSYLEDGEVIRPSPLATPELAAELWQRSVEWTAPFR